MTILYPGDQIHVTFWHDPLQISNEEMQKQINCIFNPHGVNVYSSTAVSGGTPFPMQIVVFRQKLS